MARAKPVSVTIGTQPFVCTVCRSALFWERRTRLPTHSGVGFAPSATGLLCTGCGYLHWFQNDNLRLWKQDEQQ
ncbi:hypothetical protein SAMN04489712_11878 [Thermomonospora echinospora]|uniref:Uncharacterized protein n=1 Tax=Thermomonospora echinospora TaxID=1992 RepID=A0A1H6DKJ0_9ACTN|nr:hypothetical protein SAMN04489712_11878 [Thermomonospora echinospora]